MKRLVLLIIGMALFSGMVLGGSGLFQTDYFHDESGGQVTGVQSELYDENKNHVHSKHSGGSNSITFEYPHTGTQSNPDKFYHFFYKDCYLPLEATEEAWGTGEHIEWQNTFEKASSCRSPIDTFSIKNDEHPNEPIIVDVDATLAAQAHSAFTNAMHNWFPSGYENHYSAQTKIDVEILHEGNVVHTDSKTVYIMMDESKNVQFSWTPGMEGEFTAKITTEVIDCQCESGSIRQSSKDFEIWADKPYDECYTLIQELKAQPEFPEVGDNLDITFEKISNYADTNHDKTPLPTNVDYVITDSSNSVVFQEQKTLSANSNGLNYETHSFNWQPSESGNYNIRVTGVAQSNLCQGKNNPEDTANLGITVDAEEKYSVTFEVKDSESGNAISGASVSLGTQSGTTNWAGRVSFDKSPGTYGWDVTAQDYSSDSGSVNVVNQDQTVEVNLEPVVDKHTVTFNVVDASTGFGVQGAHVELGSYSGTTNNNGRVVFDNVEEGNYNWGVSKNGYYDSTGSVYINSDKEVDVSLQAKTEEYDVTFEVTDCTTNDAISNGQVVLDGESKPTDGQGKTVFSDISEGTYDWEVNKFGYESKSSSITVDDDKTIDVCLEPVTQYHDVTFNVMDDETGDTLSGALVELDSMSSTTDGSGQVVFNDVEEGSYNWEVSKEGYHSESSSILVDEDKIVDVPLTIKQHEVVFEVTDSDTGSSIENAVVTLNGYTGTTDDDGLLVFDSVDSGSYNWEAEKQGYGSNSGNIDVYSDKLVEVPLTMQEHDVTFEVTDSNTGSKIEGAEVTLNGYTDETDADGLVVFQNVMSGSYNWEVEKQGYDSNSGSIDVYSDKLVEVPLTIQEHDITFEVTDSDTGSSIENAVVTLNGHTGTTDANGLLVLDSVNSGSFNWEVEKQGYYSNSGSIDVYSDKLVEVPLTIQEHDVTFEVTDSNTGSKIEGAKVTLNGYTDETDTDGVVVFENVISGSYNWEVEKQGYDSNSGSIDVYSDKLVEVPLTIQEHDVTFEVTDGNTGSALEGAEVSLNGYTGETDADGVVVFEDVKSGSYNWVVEKQGYHNKSSSIDVYSDKLVEVFLMVHEPPVLNVFDQFLEPGSGLNEKAVDLWDYTKEGCTSIEDLDFYVLSQSNTSVVDCSLSSNRYLDCEVMEGVNMTFSDLELQVRDNTNIVNDSFRMWVIDEDDIINLLNPQCGDVVSGVVEVKWESIVADSIDIEYSINDGEWKSIAENITNDGLYEWDTWFYESQSTYHLRVIARDKKGNKIGYDKTDCHFTVYNDRFPTREKEITRHSMFISQAQMIPSDEKATAGEYVQLYLSVSNNGDFDLDNVRMYATSHDFGERASAGPFDLRQGESESRVLDLYVPWYIGSGEYPVRITISNEDTTRTIYRDIDVK